MLLEGIEYMDVGFAVAKGVVDIYAYFSKRHRSVLHAYKAGLLTPDILLWCFLDGTPLGELRWFSFAFSKFLKKKRWRKKPLLLKRCMIALSMHRGQITLSLLIIY